MRLEQSEQLAIVQAVRDIDPSAEIWLFGSRAKNELRGGDIDLLLISGRIGFAERIDLLVELKIKLGDQRVDLHIIRPEARQSDSFALSVLPGALRLDPA